MEQNTWCSDLGWSTFVHDNSQASGCRCDGSRFEGISLTMEPVSQVLSLAFEYALGDALSGFYRSTFTSEHCMGRSCCKPL